MKCNLSDLAPIPKSNTVSPIDIKGCVCVPVLVTSMERPFVGINLDAARTRTGAISPFLSDRDFQMATRKKAYLG